MWLSGVNYTPFTLTPFVTFYCILDKKEKITKFITYRAHATLHVTEGTNLDKAQRLLEKSENTCLITNSLSRKPELSTTISTAGSLK